MKKLTSLTLLALIVSIASYSQVLPIFGTPGCCVGGSSYLYDSTTGGTWSSSSTAIATIGTIPGEVMGVSAGVVTITYTVGGSYATYSYTVSPNPTAIVGAASECVGSSATLTDATPGGIWTSSAPTIAEVGSVTGVVTGISAGSTSILYTMGTGCYVIHAESITSTTPPAAITGPSSVCVGSTITLADATAGGVWTISTPAVATISGSGVVTGISTGADTIYYTVTGSCGTSFNLAIIHVISTVSAGTISGTTTVAVGATTTLSDGVSGGTWSSSSTSIATVGATGIVTGVATGTVTITYSVTACGGTDYTTTTVTVTAAPPVDRISGHVNFTGGPLDSGYVKVWLITYDTATLMLEASDSVTLYSGGTSEYYQFLGEPADSYRVKAAYYPAVYTGTGYIPTYHTASFYWNSADVFYHTSGTADDGEDINMAYGSVTSGAGFIGGNVTLGANRGTSVTVPAVGLLMYVLNSAGNVLQMTTTDASGNYSFNNLHVGATYTIYPEDINYATTAYTGITLTASSPSMSAASFGQHSVSRTILPITTAIKNVTSSVSSIIAFPNPTNGKLNIQWDENTTEKGTLAISDITGRVVYASSINMTQGTGSSQLDLSELTNGMYMISIKSGDINYNNKIELQH